MFKSKGSKDGVICPHCGYLHDDSWEWCDESGQDVECYACEKPFRAYTFVQITYYGDPIEDEE